MNAKRACAIGVILSCLLLTPAVPAAELLSVDMTGTRSANAGAEERFCISGDARFVAFSSASTNLVVPDTNGISDVFVRDCDLRITLWSTVQTLTAGSGPGSHPLEFTPDGRFLLFVSRATNLVSGATAPLYQLYLQDLSSNTTRLVSVSYDGVHGSSTAVTLPVNRRNQPLISVDGRFALFGSIATDLVPGVDAGIGLDFFCRDMQGGVTELVTASPDGFALDRAAGNCYMSTNGRWFAFETAATNVVPGLANTNNTTQVYWRDRLAGTNALVSLDSTGGFPHSPAMLQSLSRDGRYVCFSTATTNIVAGQNDTNGTLDLFIRDMQAGDTWLVTRATNGNTTASGVAGGEFSNSGDSMLIAPTAADLEAGVVDINNSSPDLFVHRLPARTNTLVTRSLSGLTGANSSAADGFARLSSSGRFVLFTTTATNLLSGATTAAQRLFLRDRVAGRTAGPLGVAPFITLPYNEARFAISADERFVVFLASANYDPAVTDANNAPDLFRTPLHRPELRPIVPGNALEADGLSLTAYVLQTSTNLLDWADAVTNVTDSNGVFTGEDPLPGAPRRFYRLRLHGPP